MLGSGISALGSIKNGYLRNTDLKSNVNSRTQISNSSIREYIQRQFVYVFCRKFSFSYCGIPYSHDMCPCKICFPDEGQCNVGCRDELVSCPVIETKMSTNSSTEPSDLFNILQQPADLPNLTNMYTDKAIEYMERSVNENKPFFLYMAYHQTHHPQFAGNNNFLEP